MVGPAEDFSGTHHHVWVHPEPAPRTRLTVPASAETQALVGHFAAGRLSQALPAPQRNPSAEGTGASGLCGSPAGGSGRL
jgi:hypothetical protein